MGICLGRGLPCVTLRCRKRGRHPTRHTRSAPFGPQRFGEALERVRQRMTEHCDTTVADRIGSLTHAGMPNRVFVRHGERIVPVRLDDVHHIEAADDYVRLHACGRTRLARIGLAELQLRLDPSRFLRTHRSHVVDLDRIAAIVASDERRLAVILENGSRIVANRTGRADLPSGIRRTRRTGGERAPAFDRLTCRQGRIHAMITQLETMIGRMTPGGSRVP